MFRGEENYVIFTRAENRSEGVDSFDGKLFYFGDPRLDGIYVGVASLFELAYPVGRRQFGILELVTEFVLGRRASGTPPPSRH